MKTQALVHFPQTWLTSLALLLFFGVFLAVFLRVFLKSNAAAYQRMGSLPILEEGERHE